MRAVIDTNIFVRALIKPQGTVGPILDQLEEGLYVPLYSESLLSEVAEVLGRNRLLPKYGFGEKQRAALLELINLRGEKVTPVVRINECRDPKDNKILEVAVEGKADVIVTGDKDLLVLDPYRGIPIIGPSAFLARLGGAS